MTRAALEANRLRAFALLAGGVGPTTVARQCDVSRTTVYRWIGQIERDGVEGMRAHTAPGRPARLTAEQVREIGALYRRGPQQPPHRWTGIAFTAAIERLTGVRYQEDHVTKLMRHWGLRTARPYRRGIARTAAGAYR
jgi:transposase